MRLRYWLTIVLATILAPGCARHDPVPLTLVPPGAETRTQTLHGGFITLDLALPPGHAGPRPVVISPAIDRDTLLAAGFVLAEFTVHWERLKGLRPKEDDAAPAGRTVGKWLLASPSAATVGRGYFRFIDYDARTAIPLVLDHLATVPEVDPTRIGISGNSTLGFTALQAAARDERIAVAAVANACGDYRAFLAHSELGLEGKEPLALAPDYDAWLREREPIAHPERLPPTALLLVNGDSDRAIPLECIRPTVHALRKAYEHAGVRDRFRAVVLPGEGHEVGAHAAREILDWLVRWLAP